MIESPLLIRIVDLLIVDHPIRYALLALGFLHAYLAPQLLKRTTWRPPRVVLGAALVLVLLSGVDSALGRTPTAEKRDLVVGLFIAAMFVGGWACVALVQHLRRVAIVVREEQALTARHEARC